IITADCPGIVSHVAVRARNAHVLLATCYDRELYEELKGRAGAHLALQLSPSGDIEISDKPLEVASNDAEKPAPTSLRLHRRSFTKWAVNAEEFNREILGGKSNNLAQLHGRLPDWIRFPASMAIPFGASEAVLADAINAEVRGRIQDLQNKLESEPEATLAAMRETLLTLRPPEAFSEAFGAAWQRSGLPVVAWETAWSRIQEVWASKWSDRAFYSRRALGIPHDDLMMAVLVQEVVEADYAFVIHTVNPINGDPNQILIEVVLGLGETLVGNYPGRALGCLISRTGGEQQLLAYPGKSIGLYGSGVIFRSDSNGEDLEDFAGAGLYDSILAEEPKEQVLDYSDEPLVWDANFRGNLIRRLAELAQAVEDACGSPQDIEGAVHGEEIYLLQSRAQVGLGKGSARK
ncbi:MAG: hypothetical protein JXR97_00950, partial [Planctomycetes bacterium]|nr:hypothetical protein [Planctomycetota bacterium]